jgi:hypothetical protein
LKPAYSWVLSNEKRCQKKRLSTSSVHRSNDLSGMRSCM